VKVKDLDLKHPQWVANHHAWQRLDMMLRGGSEIKRVPELFLNKRPMEGDDVYASRCERFTYQDVLGTALGWYSARLFGVDKSPIFTFTDPDSKTDLPDLLKNFLADCDGTGNSLTGEAQQTWFPRAVAFGHMYIFIDRRKVLPDAQSLMDQEQAGVFDPYIATFDPLAAINWGVDDDAGTIEWIVFKVEKFKSAFGKTPIKVWRWFYIDKTEYAIYEAPADGPNTGAASVASSADDSDATLVDSGPHAFADRGIVPVLKLQIPKQLAFGDRVYPIVLDHVNSLNELKWLHMQCCLAVPVITGAESDLPAAADGQAKGPTQFSEITLIELPKGGTFSWSEPKGIALKEAAERVQGLMEEIYRGMYLLSHARRLSATAAEQSGVSKYEDTRASIEVLDGFGNVMRSFFKKLLKLACIIADSPQAHANVEGMSFAEPDALGDIEEAQALLDTNPPSDTLVKEIYKDLARAKLEGKDDALLKKVLREIDAAPTLTQQRAQLFAANANQFADQATIFKGSGPVSPPPPSLPA
jgi:hypothetical protein